MVFWKLLVLTGMIFLFIEMFTPAMFFLNFAIASFITAILSLFIHDWNILIPVFVVISAILLFYLRPILMQKFSEKHQTGIEEKYIGQIAKVTKKVNFISGVVSIYDERWNARTKGEPIEEGSEVKIIGNKGLVLYVEKVKEGE